MNRSTPTGRLWRPAFFALLLAGCGHEPAAPLPKLALDPARVAVAGFSSGAAMAQQVHLAYSDRLIGAALLAGPPYHCAQGKLDTALATCMKGTPDATALAATVRERAGRQLAPLAGLAGDRVFVARGTQDTVVAASVVEAARGVYDALAQEASLQVEYSGDAPFAHVFPTANAGADCAVAAPPYLGNCGRDFAATMLAAMFGPPEGTPPAAAAGQLERFDQAPFAAQGKDPSLGDAGYLYLPPRCAAGEACGLLIVFHGCEQDAASVGETFARDAGFNRWADVYGLAVLYPQTRSSYLPLNPKACWDWWGYTGPDYDTREGAQLAWVANVAAALGVALR